MNLSDLTIIIPCYNEEAALPEVIPELLDFCRTHSCPLIVVDDGSKDRSGEILRSFQDDHLTVIRHKVNRGYGAAIKSGVFAAKTKYIVTIDADGQHRTEDILRLHETAIGKDADMVVGERDNSADTSRYRALGKSLIRLFARILMHLRIKDINSGMKLYNRDLAVQFLPFCPDGMAYSDIILLFFLHYRMLVESVPIQVRPRRSGTSVINTMTAIKTIYELWLIVILFHPFRFFTATSAGISVLALCWTIRCYLKSSYISTGSSLLWTLAFVTFFLGVITEQLYRFRKHQIRMWEHAD